MYKYICVYIYMYKLQLWQEGYFHPNLPHFFPRIKHILPLPARAASTSRRMKQKEATSCVPLIRFKLH